MQLEPLISFRANMAPHPIGATPRGQRLDIELAGDVLPGSRIGGRLAGTDYLTMRPDGVVELDVRATLTTDDGEVVSVRGSGLATIDDTGLASGTLALRFETASEALAWLNREVGIAATRADMAKGTLVLDAYTTIAVDRLARHIAPRRTPRQRRDDSGACSRAPARAQERNLVGPEGRHHRHSRPP
jgi:hypothetical protein